jgi:hypothetical protein
MTVSVGVTHTLTTSSWGCAAVLVAAGLFAPLFIHHFFMFAWSLGMQLRLVGTAAIYDKLLRLRLGALADITTGDSP